MKKLKLNKGPVFYIKIGVVLFAITGVLHLVSSTLQFINTHDFQSPVVFQEPFPLKEIDIISPVASKSAIIKKVEASPKIAKTEPKKIKPSILDLMDFIHMKESSRGKATVGLGVYCDQFGLWNEIGYNPQAKHCFDDEKAGFTKLENWLIDNVKKYGVKGALCRYNTGKPVEDCTYALAF